MSAIPTVSYSFALSHHKVQPLGCHEIVPLALPSSLSTHSKVGPIVLLESFLSFIKCHSFCWNNSRHTITLLLVLLAHQQNTFHTEKDLCPRMFLFLSRIGRLLIRSWSIISDSNRLNLQFGRLTCCLLHL